MNEINQISTDLELLVNAPQTLERRIEAADLGRFEFNLLLQVLYLADVRIALSVVLSFQLALIK